MPSVLIQIRFNIYFSTYAFLMKDFHLVRRISTMIPSIKSKCSIFFYKRIICIPKLYNKDQTFSFLEYLVLRQNIVGKYILLRKQ